MSIAGYDLCEEVFREAERLHADLMEPWSAMLADATDARERLSIMRQGLGATFRQRYPMPHEFWPKDAPEARAEASAS